MPNKLENFDIEISPLGLGCWKYDDNWGGVFEKEMIRTIHKALDSGVNLFDTAPIYGLGRSEEILGKALGKNRKNIILCTKLGLTWGKNRRVEKSIDCSPANIKREIDMSLKRLRTDYIDIYQIHWPDPNTPLEATLLTMNALKSSGKIRHIGCCNFPLDLLKEALKYAEILSVQIPYSLIDREAENGLLPFCEEIGISTLIYSPLGKGLLTGKYGENTKFRLGARRERDRYFQGQEFLGNLKILRKVKYVAERLHKTPAQVAIRWVLQNPYVSAAIFGVQNLVQFKEDIMALDFLLSSEDLELLTNMSTEEV